MRLGILGGTFDPIHYGHLFIAEEARVHFQLERVLFLPNGTPPHKHNVVTAAEHRLAMTQIAVASNACFECSSLEVEREGVAYTIDTLHLLREKEPTAQWFYITGVDTVADLMTWRQPEAVLELAQFVAATRPGFDPTLLEARLPAAFLKRIQPLNTTELPISSTEIRDRVRRGLPIRYLTPDNVVEYIQAHGLYLATETKE